MCKCLEQFLAEEMSPVSVSYQGSNDFYCSHSADKETEARACRELSRLVGLSK